MKIRLLHNLDLARIAPLPADQKLIELRRLEAAFPPHSYNPFRASILDLLNVDAGPLAILPRTPWTAISAEIERHSGHAKEAVANLEVGEGLYEYASEHRLRGRRTEFFPLAVSIGHKVVYWSPVVIEIDGRPVVPFFDPRRDSKKLTALGRQFVFSVMNERIRAADADFAEVGLAIMQFVNIREARPVVPYFDDGVSLWGFEALDEMIRETYEIWFAVLAEREAEGRRRAAGLRGSLGI